MLPKDRDELHELALAGRLTCTYSRVGQDHNSLHRPVSVSRYKSGYVNLYDSDFTTPKSRMYIRGPDTVTLYLHRDHYYDLRVDGV